MHGYVLHGYLRACALRTSPQAGSVLAIDTIVMILLLARTIGS
jgi:hypothetical protein